jgi:hypothetical protein
MGKEQAVVFFMKEVAYEMGMGDSFWIQAILNVEK